LLLGRLNFVILLLSKIGSLHLLGMPSETFLHSCGPLFPVIWFGPFQSLVFYITLYIRINLTVDRSESIRTFLVLLWIPLRILVAQAPVDVSKPLEASLLFLPVSFQLWQSSSQPAVVRDLFGYRCHAARRVSIDLLLRENSQTPLCEHTTHLPLFLVGTAGLFPIQKFRAQSRSATVFLES